MKIHEIINEDDTELNTKKFKAYIKQELAKVNMEPTGRQSANTIRFPLEGTLANFRSFFSRMNVNIQDSPQSMSGTFSTYKLSMNVPVETEEGEETEEWSIFYINNITGVKGTGRKFGTKQLTPADLGIAGPVLNKETLVSTANQNLKSNYSDHAEILSALLSKVSASSSNTISLDGINLENYTVTDLAVISKNFGEVLAGVWALNNMEYNSVTFPIASNMKLIDFFGDDEYPVSVKSGGGGKVNIQNILDALQDKVKTGKVNIEEQVSYNVFKIVQANGMKSGMLELHRYFDTEPFNILATIIGKDKADISLETIDEWLNTKSLDELRTDLSPLLSNMKKRVTDEIWNRGDKMRLIISPMGEWIWPYLNQQTEIRESMSNLAKMLSVIQVNVDVSQSTINIKSSPFGDAEFIFGWAGYAGGNKLGFKMKM